MNPYITAYAVAGDAVAATMPAAITSGVTEASIWLVLRLPLSPATPFCACSWALLSSRSA